MTSTQARRVAIVGAGVSGLSVLDALIAEGHEAVIFERRSEVAGLWNSGYESLFLFSSKTMSSFPGHPMPEEFPLFPSARQFRDYIHSYAVQRDLIRHIRFDTEVVRANPLDRGIGGWEVQLGDGTTHHFDALVAANGHLSTPRPLPVYPGRFTGLQVHTSQYFNAKSVVGDNVLVVGSGASATDMAVDSVNAGKNVRMSIRSPRYFVPPSVGSKTRQEFDFPTGTPRWVVGIVNNLIMRVTTGHPSSLGIPSPTRSISRSAATMSTLVPYWIQRGRLRVVPEIARYDGRQVTFADGSTAEIDTIIWANGYLNEMPFIADGLTEWIDGAPARIAGGILSPDLANLYFNGWVSAIGTSTQLYSSSAGVIARMVSAQAVLAAPLSSSLFGGQKPEGKLKQELFAWRRTLSHVDLKLAKTLGRPRPTRRELRTRYSWARVRLDQ